MWQPYIVRQIFARYFQILIKLMPNKNSAKTGKSNILKRSTNSVEELTLWCNPWRLKWTVMRKGELSGGFRWKIHLWTLYSIMGQSTNPSKYIKDTHRYTELEKAKNCWASWKEKKWNILAWLILNLKTGTVKRGRIKKGPFLPQYQRITTWGQTVWFPIKLVLVVPCYRRKE